MRMNYQCCVISPWLQDAVEESFLGQGAPCVCDFEMTLSWFQWYEWKANTGAPIGREFPWFVIISQISWLKVGSRWRFSRKSWPFLEKRPLTGKFSKMFFECIYGDTDPCTVWPEIGNRALFTWQKKQNFGSLSRSCFCMDLSGPAPDNTPRVPQISSKCVHFRQTREHRWNVQ